MSIEQNDDSFLSRWSKRKLTADDEAVQPKPEIEKTESSAIEQSPPEQSVVSREKEILIIKLPL